MKRNASYLRALLPLLTIVSSVVVCTAFAAPPDAPTTNVTAQPTPRQVAVNIKIIEAKVDPKGKVTSSVTMTPSLSALDGQKAGMEISGSGSSTKITTLSHLRTDGDIDFTCSYTSSGGESNESEGTASTYTESLNITRQVKPNRVIRVGGVSREDDTRVQNALDKNKKLPAIGKPYTVFYVDASVAEMIPPKNGTP